MPRVLIVTVPQIDGAARELYARTSLEAREAREVLRCDPAMIDAIVVSEYVDVDREGHRTRYEVTPVEDE